MTDRHTSISKPKHKRHQPNRRFLRWVALGAVASYTGLGRHALPQAFAQAAHGGSQSRPAAGRLLGLPAQPFDIAAGTLSSSLHAFEVATGLVIHIESATMQTWPSPGVRGVLTPDKALRALLRGTGATYRVSSSGVIELTSPVVHISVNVQAAAPVMASPKFTESVNNTPETIAVVPRTIMEQQATTTLRDVLRDVSGISLAAGEGGSQGDNLTIRGFSGRNDIFLDGIRDFGSYYRDPFDMEQVAVLEGPAGVTFGRGSTGGIVEQDSKAAQPGRQFLSGTFEAGTDLTRRMTLDWDRPIRGAASGDAFRLNVMGDEGNVAGRDVAKNRRFGVAPSLAFGMNGPTRLTLSFLHQGEDDIPDYGIPWLFNGPAPVPRQNYYGFADGNYLRTTVDVGTARLDHDVNASFVVSDQFRYANDRRHVLITEPQVNPTSTLGVPIAPDTPLDEITVNRHQIGSDSTESLLWNQWNGTRKGTRGKLRNTLVTGAEGGRETSSPVRPTDTNVPVAPLLNPDPNQPFPATSAITSRVQTTALSFGAYALDTLWLGQRWELTGGARWDSFDANYQQSVAPATTFRRLDQTPTWRGAVVYKPRPEGSIYFDYGTSFNPSAESLSLSAATADLPPETNQTVELGSKWALLQARLSLRGSIFQTVKDNAREPSPDNPLLDVLGGDQRVHGAQIDAVGTVLGTAVTAGYAYLDGKVIRSQYYPQAVGLPLANVPAHTFHAWATHTLPWHLTAGAGADYVGSRTASSTKPLDPTTGLIKAISGYWLFSAMGKLPLSEGIELQMNLDNLANSYFYDEIHPGHIIPGAGRTALIGINFKF